MKRLHAMSIPLLVALALGAIPAAASATVTIKYAGGGALPVNTEVEGFSSNLKFVLAEGAGTLECTTNTVKGKVATNGGTTATITIESASFDGAEGPRCKVNGPSLKEVEITPEGLPWTMTLEASKDKSKVTSETLLAFKGYFPGPELTCKYSKATALEDTYNTTSPLIDTISAQTFTRETTVSKTCAPSGSLSGTFEITASAKKEALEVT